MQELNVSGFRVLKGFLTATEQEDMVESVRKIARAAPFFQPRTPWGKPMSVRMTAAGKYGWFSDPAGYRYIPSHPNGADWPAIPANILSVWNQLGAAARTPDCCLVNYYAKDAKMGLHRDADEADFVWPVVSISLGDSATFRMGGTGRSDATRSVVLESGDVVVMGGAARLAYHGIDRIRFGSSRLLRDGGRINLTLRVVD